jgi:hypothetical protein
MDKYLKSKIKLDILTMFNWIPDREMIKLQYRMKTGRKLDLENPQRYTEKLQWYKLYYRDPRMADCADKYLVRSYVESKGLGNILNELYGVYDSFEEINFEKLPEQFVLKGTNGASGIGIEICKDKTELDYTALKKETAKWLRVRKNGGGREWVYYVHKPRLIAEKYLSPGEGENSLVDYKFFCFHGKPYCLYVMNERFTPGGVRQNILDLDFHVMPYMRVKIEPVRTELKKPENFDQMIEYAKILSEDFPYVRVDLYDIDGKIYFGEMTFFPESGYYDFKPDEFDYILGEKFVLGDRNEKK